MSSDSTDYQFIFREIEFEDEQFHAASFVAKYRRVTSLESLRDQLRLYCDALKQQLYGIINRDYKDFITIATKLDGVDVRAEHLRKPLVDLRLDLAALHDGMVSSMQTIEDKLRHREEVVTKRRMLEATLACMEKLDTAEEIVLNVQQQAAPSGVVTTDGAKGSGLRRRALLKSFSKAQGLSAYSSLSRDIFDCSELERAAHSAAQAQRFLSSLSLSAGNAAVSSNQRVLEQRLARLIEQLVQRVRARLSAIFSSAVSASANAASKTDTTVGEGESSGFPSRAFAHCLRALVALSRGEVAEEVVAETVTRPLSKPLLTQGRVDDTGGRGSYLGLRSALESLAEQVMAALVMPVQVCEETFPHTGLDIEGSSSSGTDAFKPLAPIDLIMRGVWQPVAALLAEKFPGMFSVGIAGTLSRCYLAVEAFVSALANHDPRSSMNGKLIDHSSEGRRERDLSSHPAVAQFHNSWKLDLYLQLRTQEIFGRLDYACQLVGQHGLVTKVIEDIYNRRVDDTPPHAPHVGQVQVKVGVAPPNTPVVTAVVVPHLAHSSLTLTLSPSELLAVRALALPPSQTLQLSISEAFCIEMVTCLTPTVALRALSTRFFILAIRLVMRFEAYAAVTAESPTPSFNRSALAALMQQQSGANGTNSSSAAVMITPVKSANPSAVSPASTTPAHTGSSATPAASASIDDLVLLASDLDTLTGWLVATFGPLAEKALGINSGSCGDESPLRLCLAHQQTCLRGTRIAVWGRVCSALAVDCKKALAAVRAVAAKYRMTNKPAPEAPSPYVESILQPFRSFLDRHGFLASSLAAADSTGGAAVSWEGSVLEDVTAGYLMQVQALMETVKQMDSALQRRSKLRTAAPVGTNMADSDKISLQLFLDVHAYGQAVSALCPSGDPVPSYVPSYSLLVAEVAPAERLLDAKSS